MRKRITIGMLLLLGLAVGLPVFRVLFSNEPKYHGKRLSAWFKQYYRSGLHLLSPDEIDLKDATAALRAIGTNAVPWLVDRCFDLDPDWALRAKVQPILHEKLRFPPYVDSETISMYASWVLWEIRPSADMVLPLVTNRLQDPNPAVRAAAIRLLGCIGTDGAAAVPWLKLYLHPTNQNAGDAAFSLSLLETQAAPTVPELIELLQVSANEQKIRYNTYFALGSIGAAASNAIPVLRMQLDARTNVYARAFVAKALCQIDSGQNEALDTLLAMARDPTKTYARATLRILGEIGPNAKRAAPTLLELLKGDDVDIWSAAGSALWKIGETNLVLATLNEKLVAPESKTRIQAAAVMLDLEPTHLLAISNLIASVRDPSVADLAASELVKLRPVPPSAASVLRDIATDEKNASHRNAAKALEVLEYQADDQRKAH
jgi:HEAT repeat protein